MVNIKVDILGIEFVNLCFSIFLLFYFNFFCIYFFLRNCILPLERLYNYRQHYIEWFYFLLILIFWLYLLKIYPIAFSKICLTFTKLVYFFNIIVNIFGVGFTVYVCSSSHLCDAIRFSVLTSSILTFK